MYRLLVSALYVLIRDAETVHRLSRMLVGMLGIPPFDAIVKALTHVPETRLTLKVFDLTFKNPVGLAGGMAKDRYVLKGLEALSFGFLEIGTFTKVPQEGNEKPRLFRYAALSALVNRMGFNNEGVESLRAELLTMRRLSIPLGISIGKSKDTGLAQAPREYVFSLSRLYEVGDYFALNVSSPNTPGLRKLQDREYLIEIMEMMNDYRNAQPKRKPILVKISPDLPYEALDEIMDVCKEHDIDGIIATNTTNERHLISGELTEPGGLSGKPLRDKATEVIRYIHRKSPDLPIIGVGGIFTARDAYDKIRAGASLVQVYTGFVFEGPFLVRRINRGLLTLLKRDGYSNIRAAIGTRAQ